MERGGVSGVEVSGCVNGAECSAVSVAEGLSVTRALPLMCPLHSLSRSAGRVWVARSSTLVASPRPHI